MESRLNDLTVLAQHAYGDGAEARSVKRVMGSGVEVIVPNSYEVFVDGFKLHDVSSFEFLVPVMVRAMAQKSAK